MNDYEEIRKLVENSRKIFSKTNESSKNEIKIKYGILTEEDIFSKKDSEDIGKPKDKEKTYKIQGNYITLNGKKESDIQLTSKTMVRYK